MTPGTHHRQLLLENTTRIDRLFGRTVGVWWSRGKEVWTFARAYRRAFSIIFRVSRSGPWPEPVTLRDGRKVTLASNREAWMHAHNSMSPPFQMTEIGGLADGAHLFEFVLRGTNHRVRLRFPPGVGDPGIFLSGEYRELPVKDRTVVDVGAGAGESSIYFSLTGATRVIAFEPLPVAYDQAVRNVTRNGLESNVEVVRCAVGANPGEILVDRSSGAATTRVMSTSGGVEPTEVTTLARIVDRYALRDASLKIDCEGDEYDLVLATPPAVLRRFHDIAIEYHFGSRQLRAHLEKAGFRVRAHVPVYVPGSPAPGVYFGLLLARRIDEA